MKATKIRSLILKIITIGIILVVMFFVIKTLIVTVWLSDSAPTTYAVYGEDGRIIKLIFLEKNNTLIWYNDPNIEFNEVILTHMRGSYATHYFWKLWYIDEPGISFGWRIYPEGVIPVSMEIEVLKKYSSGMGESTFPKMGEKFDSIILFKDNAIEFENMKLEKERTDPIFVQDLLLKAG